MSPEVAIMKMVQAARDEKIAPAKLARSFKLALTKVASTSPQGEKALQIVKNDMIKDLLKGNLKIGTRTAKTSDKALEAARPRRGRPPGSKNRTKTAAVTKKPRGQRKSADAA